jgi:hypothetical protein
MTEISLTSWSTISFSRRTLRNVAIEWLANTFRNRQIPVSNFGPETLYPDRLFVVIPSHSRQKQKGFSSIAWEGYMWQKIKIKLAIWQWTYNHQTINCEVMLTSALNGRKLLHSLPDILCISCHMSKIKANDYIYSFDMEKFGKIIKLC